MTGQTDAELLAALGLEPTPLTGIEVLKHVRPAAERFAAERAKPDYIARAKPCKDAADFARAFKTAAAYSYRFKAWRGQPQRRINAGDMFILNGQYALVAKTIGARLRVIFGNKTECDMLAASLVRALYKDPAARTFF